MLKLFEKMPKLNGKRIIIKKLTSKDIELINKMMLNQNVYKYTPTFVPEKQNNIDTKEFINKTCNKYFKEQEEIILGVYLKKPEEKFCGIAELYHYDKRKKQISIGGRFDEEYWNQGIASEALFLAIEYLFKETDIKAIVASNIVENKASGRVLEKSGFVKFAENVKENWGFDKEVIVDKWILEKNQTKNKDKTYMDYAIKLSTKANCIKGQVGAILVKNNKIIAEGVNNVPKGIKPCTEETCIRKKLKLKSGENQELCFVVHAEQNAILDALKKKEDITKSTLYVTKQPCIICAKMLINAGIKKIIYLKAYPDKYSESLLKEAKIDIKQYKGE